MKNKTPKPKSKPIDTKPKPPIKKPAKKPSKARMQQPGRDKTSDPVKDQARSALSGLRKLFTILLSRRLLADLTEQDDVSVPRQAVDDIFELFASIEVGIVKTAGLEEEYEDRFVFSVKE
jgi:hypothetical protein